MLRNFFIFLFSVAFLLCCGLFFRVDFLAQASSVSPSIYMQLSIFGDVFDRVRNQYVTKPDENLLIENAINGMLHALDPYSAYLNSRETKEMRDVTKGEFAGIGIEVTSEKDFVKVIAPISGAPASKVGILAGDLITHIDGESIKGKGLEFSVNKIRGVLKTPVKITIFRKGLEKSLDFKVVRDVISVKPIKFQVEKNVGYIRISLFNEKTTQELEIAIQSIKKKISPQKLKGYILDLRLNPGGLLDQAVAVSDVFLERGKIVSTRGRELKDLLRFNATPGDKIDGKPLIVLIDGGSASASEIVAGALQDHQRATIVGTRSFGKGSVQTIMPLSGDAALRLTTALYYTPSGKSIQGKGIIPDVIFEQVIPKDMQDKYVKAEQKLKALTKQKKDEAEETRSFAYVPASLKDDAQYHYALDLLRGEKKHPAFPKK